MHNEAMGALWDVDQVAKYLQTTKEWVYRNYRHLKIPYRKVGNQLRFIPAEIQDWVNDLREIA